MSQPPALTRADVIAALDELATVEHALVAEYLEMSHVLGHGLLEDVPGPSGPKIAQAADAALSMARVEMSHLLRVNRVLTLAGDQPQVGKARPPTPQRAPQRQWSPSGPHAYLRPVAVRIGFLRAVNLGKRRVAMPRLVEVLEGLGYGAVWTHINSGNIIFEASGSRTDLERAMGEAFESAFGFEVTTFVRTAAELRHVVAAEPFRVGPGDTHFVTLLKSRVTPAQRKSLEALTNHFDTLVVDGRDVHWRMHGKSSDTTLPAKAWEAIVGPKQSTSRNITMLRKLMAKIDGP